MMRARLERDVGRRAGRGRSGRTKCIDFRVWFTGSLVPAFTNDATIRREDTSHTRIRLRRVDAAARQPECARHQPGVGGTKCDRIRHGDGPGYLFLLKSSGSSDICSRAAVESEISWRRRTSSWNSVTSWKLR